MSTQQKKNLIKKPDKKTVTTHTYNITVHEENILPFNSILLFALAFLLLLALLFIRRKREKD